MRADYCPIANEPCQCMCLGNCILRRSSERYKTLVEERDAALSKLAALEQAITDPENQPSQYGTITLDEHEKKVSAITEKYSDAVDRFVKEREKVFALEQAAEPVGWMTESEDGKTMLWPTFAEALTYCDEDERPIPLYTHPAPRSPDMQDAYIGAMEDLSIWKRRALQAEELNRKFIAETNGPTFMGEPLLPAHPARKPMTREDMRKLLAEHFDNGDLTGADFSLIRAVERFHDIKE
jgi:hypothetical protein